ncbi:hypothetical protein ABZ464_04765 [Streptomyces sp. NPDC005820]|uniref:hypothetical protein n=1 Tax=Streptomyces sp. NPDC005820 TaxID=3157069 RepID=UPI003406ED84
MRRTAPFLLAAALLAAAGPVAVADPAAEVGPGSVDPGGSVTVSVSCDPLGGTAPQTLDAVSQAFTEGTVKLDKVPGEGDGDGDATAGPAYQGSAHVAPDLGENDGGLGPDTAWTVDGTCPAPPGGQGSAWSATFDVNRPTTGDIGSDSGIGSGGNSESGSGSGSVGGNEGVSGGLGGGESGGVGGGGSEGGSGGGTEDIGGGGGGGVGESESGSGSGSGGFGGGVGGAGIPPCPLTPGQSAPSCDGGHPCPHDKPCATARPTERPTTPATVEHGVRAGTGGTFGDSVPALVAGGLLIAGAFGAAAHRLLRRRRTPADA